MLILHAFFILVLSSLVMAAPPPRGYQQSSSYDPPKVILLKGTHDFRLTGGVWGLQKEPPEDEAEKEEIVNTWSFGMDCDDFIQIQTFEEGTIISVFRLQRTVITVDGKKRYSLDRKYRRPNQMVDAPLITVYRTVPEAKWEAFLHGTTWARESDIVGLVSDGIMMILEVLTEWLSQQASGPRDNNHLADVIDFEMGHQGMQVTFSTRAMRPQLLGTINWYVLTKEELDHWNPRKMDAPYRDIRVLGKPESLLR